MDWKPDTIFLIECSSSCAVAEKESPSTSLFHMTVAILIKNHIYKHLTF